LRNTSQDEPVINIFVGNLDSSASEQQLYSLFERYGSVESVTIVKDRNTGEVRGFAFVEMTQDSEAQAAIASLNGTRLNERTLRVNEARPKVQPESTRQSGTRDHRRHQI
jgi:cold-inducible RNA-binding protein